MKEEFKHQIQKYDRHSTASISDVLPLITEHFLSDNKKAKAKAEVNGQRVGISSLRLKTFAQTGIICQGCGLEATYFAIERPPNSNISYHLNLWGHDEDGDDILFTHDHIVPRCDGGEDRITNTQTM